MKQIREPITACIFANAACGNCDRLRDLGYRDDDQL